MKPIWGLLAEFENSEELLQAARKAHKEGYRKMDAYSPFPVADLPESMGVNDNSVALACLVGGILGGLSAYLLQFWITTKAFPINVGGRPLHSWPSYIPVTFEMTVLFASFGAFFGMWALNGLPMPFHPLFSVKRFAGVTRNRFFLCIESADPRFDMVSTREFLMSLNPQSIEEVPHR